MDYFDDLTDMGREILLALNEMLSGNEDACDVSELLDVLIEKHKGDVFSNHNKNSWKCALLSLNKKGYISSTDWCSSNFLLVKKRGFEFFKSLAPASYYDRKCP